MEEEGIHSQIYDLEREDEIRRELEQLEKEFGIRRRYFTYSPNLFDPNKSPELTFFSTEEQIADLRARACELCVSELGFPEEVIDPDTGNLTKTFDFNIRLKNYRQMIRAMLEDEEEQGTFIPYYEIGSTERLPPYSFRRLKILKNIQNAKLTLSKQEYQRQQSLYFSESDPNLYGKAPIREGEIFDSDEEMKNLLKTDHKARKRLLESFKEKLYYQREGWAKLRQRIVQDITFDPEISRVNLIDVVETYRSRYGFPEKHIETVEYFIDNYIATREMIKRIPLPNETPEDFCERLTGVRPKGAVELEKWQIAIVFKFRNREDFIRVFKSSKGESEKAAGAVLTATKFAPLNNKVIIIDLTRDVDFEIPLRHEQQHVIDFFLMWLEIRHFPNFSEIPSLEDIQDKSPDSAQALSWLTDYLKKYQKKYLLEAKYEIFAYKRDQNYSSEEIIKILTGNSISYDYSRKLRESIINYKGGKIPKFRVRGLVNKILISEYNSKIREGVEAFDRLLNSGYSIEEAIGFLSLEAPWRWKRAVKNLLEIKTKSNPQSQ